MAAPAHSHGLLESERRRALVRLLYLSIGAALLTILLKAGAFVLTGSVGLLSDAAESLVNLVAAIVALLVVRYATRPPDEDHPHGHDKADYFSAGFEGGLIILAAGSIAVTAVMRLLDPQPIESVGIGVAVSLVASVVNLFMARALITAGREHGSVVLEADGEHLRADVITSVGVVIGLGAVVATGWEWLDPVIALIVAVNILVTGAQLLRRSAAGLMDAALEPQTLAEIEAVLAELRSRSWSSTRCAPAALGVVRLCRCMCSCRATGRCTAGTIWRRRWRRACGPSPGAAPACSPTWNRSMIRARMRMWSSTVSAARSAPRAAGPWENRAW